MNEEEEEEEGGHLEYAAREAVSEAEVSHENVLDGSEVLPVGRTDGVVLESYHLLPGFAVPDEDRVPQPPGSQDARGRRGVYHSLRGRRHQDDVGHHPGEIELAHAPRHEVLEGVLAAGGLDQGAPGAPRDGPSLKLREPQPVPVVLPAPRQRVRFGRLPRLLQDRDRLLLLDVVHLRFFRSFDSILSRRRRGDDRHGYTLEFLPLVRSVTDHPKKFGHFL